MFHCSIVGRFCETPASDTDALQLLRNLLELVTLDDVAHLIFAEVAELDAAFQTGAHFFHVILETTQCREAAVVNWLTFSQNARAGGASNPSIGDQTSGHDPFAQLENLFHFCVADD